MDREIRDKHENERMKASEEAKRLATVKARPMGISKSPFLPKPSEREPVVPLDTNLRTETRHEERRNFDQHVKQKEAEMQALKIQVAIKKNFFRNFLGFGS